MAATQVFKTFWKSARKYRYLIVLEILAFGAGSSVLVITPLFYKRFFDVLSGGFKPGVTQTLISILIIIAALNLARVILNRIANMTGNYTQSKIMRSIVDRSFAYVIRHSNRFFSNTFTGALVRKIQRLANAYEDIDDAIKFQVVPLVVSATGMLIIAYTRSPFLLIPIAIWLGIYVTGSYLFVRWISKYNLESAKTDSEVSGAIADAITGNSNISLFNGFFHETEILGHLTERLRRLRLFRWTAYDIMFASQFTLNVAVELVVIYFSIGFWSRGILTLGDFVLLQSLIMILSENLWNLSNVFRRFSDSISDAKEMVDILETPYEIQDVPKAKKLKASAGGIVFDRVKFNYNETRTVLSDFSLDIRPGEKIALVGSSGAGKSTVVKVLFRFFDLTAGHIKIDGQDIAKVTQESLHDALSLVPQEPLLFHRTLMENIRYGRRDATDDEVYAAAKKAHCHEFISGLPDGYETLVGERGVKLSGGERQRVAIARAILKDSPILVLDEATSSLDSESEQLIQQALEALMKDKTVIVIAHRLSTIAKMDRIIVMENGKIIDQGTHDALVRKRDGTYKKLWEIQAGGFIS